MSGTHSSIGIRWKRVISLTLWQSYPCTDILPSCVNLTDALDSSFCTLQTAAGSLHQLSYPQFTKICGVLSETRCDSERICTAVGTRLEHGGRRSEPFALGLPVTAHLWIVLQYQQQPIKACGKHLYHLPWRYNTPVLNLHTTSDSD